MTDWMIRGLCAEEAHADLSVAELFFPDPGGKNDAAEAKELCSRCSVRVDCLRFAMSTAVDGIWGGTTAKERQEIRRRIGAPLPSGWARPINHGTEAGAAQHRRRGESPCPSCREGSAQQRRERQYREAAK